MNGLFWIIVFVVSLSLLALIVWYIAALQRRTQRAAEAERETRRQFVQTTVLAQIAERIGYTLDAEEIIEVISSSLEGLIPFASVSYVLQDPDTGALRLRVVNHRPLAAAFSTEVKRVMRESLDALIPEVKGKEATETVFGPTDPDGPSKIGSFFNLPIVLDGKAVGLINIASPDAGLYTADQTEVLYKVTSIAASAVERLRRVIRNEQRRMNSMVSSLDSGLFMVDAEERLVVVNARMRTILGVTEDAPLHFAEVLGGLVSVKGLSEAMHTSMQHAISRLGPVELGNAFYQIVVTPVRDETDAQLGSVVVFEDITQQKELERVKERFTAMMVHELRSPLTGLRWQIEALTSAPRVTKAMVKELGATALPSIGELLELVTDMLDADKIEAGQFTITPAMGDLAPIAQEAVDRFAAVAKETKTEIAVEADPALAPFAFDANRVRQSIVNYLSNALKYAPGKPVAVRLRKMDGHVRIDVADSGPGIPEADRSKLFTQFARLNETGKIEGTGLGLAIVKGIAEAHGGKAGFEPNVPMGSIFWIDLPTGDLKTAVK